MLRLQWEPPPHPEVPIFCYIVALARGGGGTVASFVPEDTKRVEAGLPCHAEFTGLAPSTPYALALVAEDAHGRTSSGNVLHLTTPPA